MIQQFRDETKVTFSVLPPLYLPFYNSCDPDTSSAYFTYSAFSHDPFCIPAGSTSGSPVVLTPNGFFGFMNEDAGGTFSYDGCGTLTVTCRKGQALYFEENCDPYGAWMAYNKTVLEGVSAKKSEDFWGALEYNTWAEQKKAAMESGFSLPQDCLCESFVYDYMRRVDRMGMPHGKLTIDDGWDERYDSAGFMRYGNWDIDREKFPHMEQLVQDMMREGFTPGLWLAPFAVTPNSSLALHYPRLLGELYPQDAENPKRKLTFLKPDGALEKYYHEIFSRYIEMGFRKFKLDMAYGPKNEMKELLRIIYGVIKRIDNFVEVEAHIPDLFASRYCDTVRIPDVFLDDAEGWRGAEAERYKVCRYSAPDKLLNLGTVGGSTPVRNEEKFLAHLKLLMSFSGGHPTISQLPDTFGIGAVEIFAGTIREWDENRKNAMALIY